MLCVVVSSKLQESEGKRVREWMESILGFNTILLTEPSEVEVDDGLIIVPATGGTERIISKLIESTDCPIMIWALSGNSLSSALEVYSVYRDRVRLSWGSIGRMLDEVGKFVGMCRFIRSKQKLGLVGGVSEWLLTSDRRDAEALGVELIEFELEEILKYGKDGIQRALEEMVKEHGLSAITVRCFDLLKYDITACLALANLDIPAGCEGDIGATLTMMILHNITGKPCWMANVCKLDPFVLAHCTVPLKMVERYELTTHAESGKGVAIRGKLREGTVTLSRYGRGKMLIALGRIVRNLREDGFCRTQVELEPYFDVEDFVENALGNHVVLTYGDLRKDLKDFCKFLGIKPIILRPYRLHHISGAD